VRVAERAASGRALSGGLQKEEGHLSFVVLVLSGDQLKEVSLEPPSVHRQGSGHGLGELLRPDFDALERLLRASRFVAAGGRLHQIRPPPLTPLVVPAGINSPPKPPACGRRRGPQKIRNFKKLFLTPDPNQVYVHRRPVPLEGVRDRHKRGTGCGGRGCAFDERRVMRTAKSCGPDASVLASSRRSFSAGDGGKKADHRGARYKP